MVPVMKSAGSVACVDMEDRFTIGRMQNPVRGFLHGSAAVVSVAGIVVLVRSGNGAWSRLALGAFGVALVFLFSVSALYHSIPWAERAKSLMQRLDHTAIFVLIAGSYTAVAGIAIDGPVKWITLGMVWGVGAWGITHNIFFPGVTQRLSIILLLVMGWVGIVAAVPIANAIGTLPFGLLVVGGLLYTTGTIAMVMGRPRLWPRVFSSHEVFHVMVVAAAAIHFIVAVRYVAPLA
jgi:hemolysin III